MQLLKALCVVNGLQRWLEEARCFWVQPEFQHLQDVFTAHGRGKVLDDRCFVHGEPPYDIQNVFLVINQIAQHSHHPEGIQLVRLSVVRKAFGGRCLVRGCISS